MPSYKTVFGSWLKTEDLQGRHIPVTIESVAPRMVKTDDGEENKLIAHFVGKEKELILNMTNCDMLAQITGTEDYDRWVGARVILYPTTTRFGNKTVPCLRIRQMQPQMPVPSGKPIPPPQYASDPPAPPAPSPMPTFDGDAFGNPAAGVFDDSDVPF